MKHAMNDKYAKQFDKRHGKNAARTFDSLLWEVGKLSIVGKRFNFTRANASIIFSNLYNVSFKEFKDERLVRLGKPQTIYYRKKQKGNR